MNPFAALKGSLAFQRLACLAMPAVAALAFVSSANAQTVLVDMGNTTSFRGISVPTPDANGHTWNSIVPGALVPSLVNNAGAATGIGMGWDTPVGTDSFNGPFGGATNFPNPTPAQIAAVDAKLNKPALGSLGVAEAAIDYAAGAGAGLNVTIFDLQNLNPAATYSIRFYGSHIFSADTNTVYAAYSSLTGGVLGGAQGSASLAVQAVDVNDPGLPPNIPNTASTVTLSGLHSNASGQLFVSFTGENGNEGYLNSFELIGTVPEPTSLALVGLAACGLGARRRR